MYNFLGFLSFLQAILGFALMSSSLMSFKEPFFKRVILSLFLMFMGIVALSYILLIKGTDSVDSYVIFIITGIVLVWYLINSKDSFFISFFSLLTFINIYTFISYTSDALAIQQLGSSFLIEKILIRLSIYMIIVPLLFKFIRPRFRQMVEIFDGEWPTATLVPLMFLLTQTLILYYPKPYWHWESGSWMRIIIAIVYLMFLVVYYQLYKQAVSILDRYKLEERQIIMSQQEKLWQSELARQKTFITLAKQQKHDLHHHNTVITNLLEAKDYITLKKYMADYSSHAQRKTARVYCSHPIANSIFNDYANKSNKNNIHINFDVVIPEDIGIENIALTAVFGNLLENALEACLRIPTHQERKIYVESKFKDSRLRIQIENTSLDDIVFKDDLPVTQKSSGGVGTKSILYIAKKYNGVVGFSYSDGMFLSQLVLNEKMK